MNEILQKKIEKAARDIAELCPDCDLHCEGSNPCIPKILYQKLIEISIFALQNQWISVEEALPKDFKKVFFRAVGKNDSVCYGTGYVNIDDWYTDIQHIEQDYFKFKITHWMPIPSLKGDEG